MYEPRSFELSRRGLNHERNLDRSEKREREDDRPHPSVRKHRRDQRHQDHGRKRAHRFDSTCEQRLRASSERSRCDRSCDTHDEAKRRRDECERSGVHGRQNDLERRDRELDVHHVSEPPRCSILDHRGPSES